MKKILTLACCALVLIATCACTKKAQSAEEIVAQMGIGWNLGDTMDASRGGRIDNVGLSTESGWGNPVTTKEMIETVAKAGFKTLRIPTSWHNHIITDAGGEYKYTIDEAWLNRVKEIVDWAYEYDMFVIVNIHHDNSRLVYFPAKEYQEQSETYVKNIWSQVAKAFAGYDQHLIFETLNEPRLVGNQNEWNANMEFEDIREAVDIVNILNQDAVNEIRAVKGNEDRIIMCPGYAGNSNGLIKEFRLPDDPKGGNNKIALSFHAYTPLAATLGKEEYTFDEAMEQEIDALFADVKKKIEAIGAPAVLGETSPSNMGYESTLTQRRLWARYFLAEAAEYGIPVVIWDNGRWSGHYSKGEHHAHLDRKNLGWTDPELIQAFFDGWNEGLKR